jgi:hypothetical protein
MKHASVAIETFQETIKSAAVYIRYLIPVWPAYFHCLQIIRTTKTDIMISVLRQMIELPGSLFFFLIFYCMFHLLLSVICIQYSTYFPKTEVCYSKTDNYCILRLLSRYLNFKSKEHIILSLYIFLIEPLYASCFYIVHE